MNRDLGNTTAHITMLTHCGRRHRDGVKKHKVRKVPATAVCPGIWDTGALRASLIEARLGKLKEGDSQDSHQVKPG